jgi:hypothetical protein
MLNVRSLIFINSRGVVQRTVPPFDGYRIVGTEEL